VRRLALAMGQGAIFHYDYMRHGIHYSNRTEQRKKNYSSG